MKKVSPADTLTFTSKPSDFRCIARSLLFSNEAISSTRTGSFLFSHSVLLSALIPFFGRFELVFAFARFSFSNSFLSAFLQRGLVDTRTNGRFVPFGPFAVLSTANPAATSVHSTLRILSFTSFTRTSGLVSTFNFSTPGARVFWRFLDSTALLAKWAKPTTVRLRLSCAQISATHAFPFCAAL